MGHLPGGAAAYLPSLARAPFRSGAPRGACRPSADALHPFHSFFTHWAAAVTRRAPLLSRARGSACTAFTAKEGSTQKGWGQQLCSLKLCLCANRCTRLPQSQKLQQLPSTVGLVHTHLLPATAAGASGVHATSQDGTVGRGAHHPVSAHPLFARSPRRSVAGAQGAAKEQSNVCCRLGKGPRPGGPRRSQAG